MHAAIALLLLYIDGDRTPMQSRLESGQILAIARLPVIKECSCVQIKNFVR